MTYTIRRASERDLAAIIDLRAEAETWLRANGIQQWTDDYFGYARDVLATSVRDQTAWVVETDGRIIGTVTINGPDLDFWSPEDAVEPALYVGKMIVARSCKGLGLGDAILNWASALAEDRGARWIRLDVRRDNTRLHSYYLARLFQHVRTVRPANRRTESGWLAQRPAGSFVPCPVTLIHGEPAR